MRTRKFALAVVLALAAGGAALADDYPSRPIRLIVPFAAGGAANSVARIVESASATRSARPWWSRIAAAAAASSAPRS